MWFEYLADQVVFKNNLTYNRIKQYQEEDDMKRRKIWGILAMTV